MIDHQKILKKILKGTDIVVSAENGVLDGPNLHHLYLGSRYVASVEFSEHTLQLKSWSNIEHEYNFADPEEFDPDIISEDLKYIINKNLNFQNGYVCTPLASLLKRHKVKTIAQGPKKP